MSSLLLWEFTQLRFILCTDVLEQPLGHIFKGQAVKEDALTF